MKKLLTVSLVAVMAVSAAHADIASTKYVTDRTGELETLSTTAKNNLVAAINEVAGVATGASGALDDYALKADLGTAAYKAEGDFATAEQGAKADSTAQTIATYGDIVTSNKADFATAEQGQKADAALPASKLETAAQNVAGTGDGTYGLTMKVVNGVIEYQWDMIQY